MRLRSAGQRIDFFFPAGDQTTAFGTGTVLGIVVIDELDFGRVRHARVFRHLGVAGQLELLGRQAKLLATGRERPFIELLGGLGVGAELPVDERLAEAEPREPVLERERRIAARNRRPRRVPSGLLYPYMALRALLGSPFYPSTLSPSPLQTWAERQALP